MTDSGGHTALNPSEGIAKEANKRVEASSAGRGEPESVSYTHLTLPTKA